MTFRLPQNLSTQLNYERGESVLNYEIMAEKAASLGRAGKIIETAFGEIATVLRPPGRAPRTCTFGCRRCSRLSDPARIMRHDEP